MTLDRPFGSVPVTLDGDDFVINNLALIQGKIDYKTNVFVNSFINNASGGFGGGCWNAAQELGEPIPGVDIALEQKPGGVAYTGTDPDGKPSGVVLEGIDNGAMGPPVAGIKFTQLPVDETLNAISQLNTKLPPGIFPPSVIVVPVVTSVGPVDESGTETSATVDDMYFGLTENLSEFTIDESTGQPQNAIIVEGDMYNNGAGEFYTGNPDGKGGITFYHTDIIPNVSIDKGQLVPSPGDNVAQISNVTPNSPFVIMACQTCGSSGKVAICQIENGDPETATTICVTPEEAEAALNNGSYCGPCNGEAIPTMSEWGVFLFFRRCVDLRGCVDV